jgi:hypothetical protein
MNLHRFESLKSYKFYLVCMNRTHVPSAVWLVAYPGTQYEDGGAYNIGVEEIAVCYFDLQIILSVGIFIPNSAAPSSGD